MQENTKSLKKQLAAAIAMLLVAVVALGAASYAWFVSNNQVKATTSQINAQSNAAYLVIDKITTTTNSSATATYGLSNKALYPAQWKNNFDVDGNKGGTTVYQFESAYANAKDNYAEKENTRFAVGDPATAEGADYALLKTFYVGTGTYDGEFTNLKVTNMTVTDETENHLGKAMRVLIESYAPDRSGGYASTPTSWVVVKYNDGNTATIESQSGSDGIVYAPQFGKTEGDVMLKMYIYYDGDDNAVYTTNLENLTACGTTITLDATAKEFGK